MVRTDALTLQLANTVLMITFFDAEVSEENIMSKELRVFASRANSNHFHNSLCSSVFSPVMVCA